MFYISALFLISAAVGGVLSDERHCSKFHYEEKLLEKMVRMEIQMEKLQEQLDIIKQKSVQTGKFFFLF